MAELNITRCNTRNNNTDNIINIIIHLVFDSDIYGVQVGFDVKLDSLKTVWGPLVQGFHSWFLKKRETIFKNNLVQTSRARLKIAGRYYSNGLESHHRLIKKELTESGRPRSMEGVNQVLYNRTEKYYIETEIAVRGIGEYRLAQGYEHFFVSTVKWAQWSSVRRQQHMEAFFDFTPKTIDQYKKPASAGHNMQPRKKRRCEQIEPEFQVDRIQTKNSDSTTASSTSKNNFPKINPLDPDRPAGQEFYLVHRSDHKNCPSKTKRCHSCKRLFSNTDWVVVRTEGQREYTNPQGKIMKSNGNVSPIHKGKL